MNHARTLAICLCLFSKALFGQESDDANLRKAVVKVWSTQSQLNLSSPWQRGDGREVSGSGVWLGERRVLTNAHVIERATQVFIQTSASSDRVPATVKFYSTAMDLALLELEDDSPFNGVTVPTLFPDIPKLRSMVRVYGFPEGGTTLSVTEGIISRIEFVPFAGGKEGLRIQIDAAVNQGNSGGPAILDGRVVGLVFQRRQAADNIGYLISNSEIKLFLDDIQDGKYDGKYDLYLGVQRLQNKALRDQLGVPKELTGLWLRQIRFRDADFPLRIGDVLTHVGDRAIDNSGLTDLNSEVKVVYTYHVSQLAKDGKVPFKVYREGKTLDLQIPVLREPRGLLRDLDGGYPDWFVHGPFVFSEATDELLRGVEFGMVSGDERQRVGSFGAIQLMGRRLSPLLSRRFEQPAFPGEQLVLVVNWLPHRISTGYSGPQFQTLGSVNGQKVKNLRHAAELICNCQDEFLVVEFIDTMTETLVFRRTELEAATKDVMNNVGIPRRSSESLLEVWEKKGS